MLLESLGMITRLGDIVFKKQPGYQFPVAEVNDTRAKTILNGEAIKISRGIQPVIREAVSKTPAPKTDPEPKTETVAEPEKPKRERKPRKPRKPKRVAK